MAQSFKKGKKKGLGLGLGRPSHDVKLQGVFRKTINFRAWGSGRGREKGRERASERARDGREREKGKERASER